MMRENDSIEKIIGKENPFKVPEGYFEGLTDSIMQNINRHEARRKNRILKVYRIAAAAIIIGIVAAGGVFFNMHNDKEMMAEKQAQIMDQALDYAMISNDEIYHYLAEEY